MAAVLLYVKSLARWHDVTAARHEGNSGFTATEGLNPNLQMSCRIDRRVTGDLVVLSISGQITGPDVEMLREVLDEEEGGLAIDLKNVSLVDREAVKLLARCESNGTELRNCLLYIREWVSRERAETDARPPERL